MQLFLSLSLRPATGAEKLDPNGIDLFLVIYVPEDGMPLVKASRTT